MIAEEQPPRTWIASALSCGMVVLGIAALLLASLMVMPVAVNWPASWFGGLLVALIAIVGHWLIYRGSRRLIANARGQS